ncbi:MAG: hypothetical protein SOX69_02345 [Oscillospiraceae bacterium]|nr:hypothetical protein [Oscillospiraceae bacterium]
MIFSDKDIPAATRDAVRTLAERRRLPQSVMLTGGSETLREKCAKELTEAVLCTAPKGVPCGRCADCLKAKAGVHPDVIRVVPDGSRKTLSVDNVRGNVRDTLWIAPNEAENKVYIFPNADELSPQVQNALLKSIEEPPDFVMFVFLAARRESFLTTVISRTTEFVLGDVSVSSSKKADEAAGSVASAVIAALCTGNEYDIMISTAVMHKNRKLIKRVAAKTVETVRDAMAERSGTELISDSPADALRLASAFNEARLLKIKAAMDKIMSYSDMNANENLLISEFSALLGDI